jgi:hypothetical protein
MSAKTTTAAPPDAHEDDLNLYNRVMDNETAQALFKAMAVLAMGIESTMSRSLDRAYLAWPETAEAVWDMLDGIMVRAGVSDGKDRPWISELEGARAGAKS